MIVACLSKCPSSAGTLRGRESGDFLEWRGREGGGRRRFRLRAPAAVSFWSCAICCMQLIEVDECHRLAWKEAHRP